MIRTYAMQSVSTAQKHANGAKPFVGVLPVIRYFVGCSLVGGTPNPLLRWGSEFNQLAPHTPEGLDAPRSAFCRAARYLGGASQYQHDASRLSNVTRAQDEYREEEQP